MYLVTPGGAVTPLQPQLPVVFLPFVHVQREAQAVGGAAGHLVPQYGLDVRHPLVAVQENPRAGGDLGFSRWVSEPERKKKQHEAKKRRKQSGQNMVSYE